jgi:excisionase family DNA binding protein
VHESLSIAIGGRGEKLMNSDLLDVEEGAVFLHVKSSTVRSWILKGQVPFVKLGRRVFLRRPDLEALITSSVVPARQPLQRAEQVEVTA